MEIHDEIPYEEQEDRNVNAFSKKLYQKQNIDAQAKGFSKGKGMSMVGAGPSGSHSQAEGTHGTGVSTNFKNANNQWEDSWGFQSDGTGNVNKFGKKWGQE